MERPSKREELPTAFLSSSPAQTASMIERLARVAGASPASAATARDAAHHLWGLLASHARAAAPVRTTVDGDEEDLYVRSEVPRASDPPCEDDTAGLMRYLRAGIDSAHLSTTEDGSLLGVIQVRLAPISVPPRISGHGRPAR